MTIAGHADEFTRKELIEFGKKFDIKNPEIILEQTIEVFSKWSALAQQWGVQAEDCARVAAKHRLFNS